MIRVFANEQATTTNEYTITVVLTHERCNLCGVHATCVFMQLGYEFVCDSRIFANEIKV